MIFVTGARQIWKRCSENQRPKAVTEHCALSIQHEWVINNHGHCGLMNGWLNADDFFQRAGNSLMIVADRLIGI